MWLKMTKIQILHEKVRLNYRCAIPNILLRIPLRTSHPDY